jgi:hypothetical protein
MQHHKYMIMDGPSFYKEVGGLVCTTCGCDSQVCKCEASKVNEKVKNLAVFEEI